MFKDRQSAGKLLAKHLKHYKGKDNVLVLGIPRGGVVVASAVAESLNLPLDIIVTRKIGALTQPELALGAVDPDGEVVWDQNLIDDLGSTIYDLKETVKNEVEEITRREDLYRREKKPLNVGGKTVILVDDGIATGATTLSAVRYLKRHEAKKIILAIPVASKEPVEKIIRELGEFGEVVVLETPEYFQAVGQFYHKFEPVSDEEVVQLLTS
ncbi:phosphoribosyltransferase [Candidatus Daviesbacteria bacterium]|nr:phosphoribosyltransferase [Candidatus Daviesbacteria bacterium]